MRTRRQAFEILAILCTALMLVQALLGLLRDDLYRDNLFVRSAWRGNDLVTLLVALPLMIWASLARRRESARGYLVSLGVMAYAFYNYSFYLFGSALNAFFLIYVALFTASAYALIVGFSAVDLDKIRGAALPRRILKPVSVYLWLWGIGLAVLWISQSLKFVIAGQVPAIVLATAHPTNIVAALDLAIMVPAVLLAAYLLLRESAWGHVLAVVVNVKGALYALVLAAGSLVGDRAGVPDVGAQIPLWLVLCLASFVSCLLLLRSGRERS